MLTTSPEEPLGDFSGPTSSSYGPSSPLAERTGQSHVARRASMPDVSEHGRVNGIVGFNGPLSTPSSELYLSLGRGLGAVAPPELGGHSVSPSSSRAPSPEMSGEASTSHPPGARGSRHLFRVRPFSAFSKDRRTSISSYSSRPSSIHQDPSSRHRQTLSVASGPSVSSSPEDLSPLSLSGSHTPASTSAIPTPHSPCAVFGEYYDVVPEYAFAARGFLGGITPLSSFRGLPSYEQAQRSCTSSPQGSLRVTGVMTGTSATLAVTAEGPDVSSSGGGASERRERFISGRRPSVIHERQ